MKWKGFILPLMVITLWFIGSTLNLFNSYIIPPPSKVIDTFINLTGKGILTKHLAVSLYRVLTGFLITFCIAFPLAVLVGMKRRLLDYIEPTLEFIRHIPPIALIPMLILWFGIGETSKLAVIILATFFPIFLNTLNGIANCDKKLLEVGEIFKLSRVKKFTHIILPQALPSIIVGMQLGLGYSWRSLIGAELIAASSGIGYMIIDGEQLSRPDIVLVGIFAIGVVGYVVDYVFLKITEKMTFWDKVNRNEAVRNKEFV